MSGIDSSTAKSYLDFSGLGELRAKAAQDQDKALKETSQQFEALFIQMMMKAMREATMKDEEHEDSARETFEGLFDREVSVQMSKRNALGVADFMERAVKQQQPMTTQQVLDQRLRQNGSDLPLRTPEKSMPLQAPPSMPMPLPQQPKIRPLQDKGLMPLRSSS